MKPRFLLLLGGCLILFVQHSCSTKFDVIGLWKDIPIVYGVINHQDSVNYIRIERAFLPPSENALDVAKNPDSLYFDTADVNITMSYINQVGDTIPWPTPFERVRLADEGITRDSGIFVNDPAYVYKLIGYTPFDLLLTIEHRRRKKTFYARTESIRTVMADGTNAVLILKPVDNGIAIPITWRKINPVGEEVYSSFAIDITSSPGKLGFASIYDYVLRFHYKEYEVDDNGNTIAGSEMDKSLEWRLIRSSIPTSESQLKMVARGEAFYLFLESNLSDVTGTNIRRCAGACEIYVDGASKSLRNYIDARRWNTGAIAGLYPTDPYSNVSGGYGVFATSDRLYSNPRFIKMSSLSVEHLQYRTLNVKNIGFISSQACY